MKITKKKITVIGISIFILLTAIISVIFWTNSPPKTTTDYQFEENPNTLSIQKRIDNSHCAVVAEFLNFRKSEGFYVWEFKNKEVIYGEAPENIIIIYTSDVNKSDLYKKNNEYLLILHRHESLMYEYGARYMLSSEEIVCLNKPGLTVFNNKDTLSALASLNKEQIIKQVKRIESVTGHEKQNSPKIFRTENLETVTKQSDIIVEAKVSGVLSESNITNAKTFICKAENILKGETIFNSSNNQFYITAYADSMEIGGNYIIIMSVVDETSLIYTQASPIGIIPADDTEIITKIKNWLNE